MKKEKYRLLKKGLSLIDIEKIFYEKYKLNSSKKVWIMRMK